MFCFTRCCTSSIQLAAPAAAWFRIPREFREEEKRFAEFERARKILDRLAR